MEKKSMAKVQIPEVRGPTWEIAAAGQRAAKQAIDKALRRDRSLITAEDLKWNDPAAEVVKGKPPLLHPRLRKISLISRQRTSK